jgi:hypothetical protein
MRARRRGFFREAFEKKDDAWKGTGFARNRAFCPIKIILDLNGDKATSRPKTMPSGGSMPGESALKAQAQLFNASQTTTK